MELTVGSMIKRSVDKFGKKIAVSDGPISLTYSQLNERANRLANALVSMGMKHGDRCGILLYNCFYWYEIYFALAKIGVISVPVNFRFATREMQYVINDSEPKILIYGKEFEEILSKIKPKLASIKKYICIGAGKGEEDYEELLIGNSPEEPASEVRETDLYGITYTSGTTGFPKGVVTEHRGRVLSLLVMATEMGGMNRTDTMLVIMLLFHANSASFSTLMHMVGGTCVVYPSGKFDPTEVLKIMDEKKITWTSFVPTMLTMILNLPEGVKKRYDLSSMRLLLCSSAPLMTKTKEDTINVPFGDG